MIDPIYPDRDLSAIEETSRMVLDSEQRLALLEQRDAVYAQILAYLSNDSADPEFMQLLEGRLHALRSAAENTPYKI